MCYLVCTLSAATDALASWQGPAKDRIVAFVTKTTTAGSDDFIPATERIAVFDNDGTLWAEQPIYFQMYFIMDRIAELAAEQPDWQTTQPYAAALSGDPKQVLAQGTEGLLQLALTAQSGMTDEAFAGLVNEWITTARHPETDQLFTEMVYQPMLELLSYLREHDYKTFIVSGGGIAFMRPWTERIYGIPPEQVIGSRMALAYQDGAIQRLPKLEFVDDKEGKPVGIATHIGRRPVIAFGNSDGDFAMLEWTTKGSGPRLGALIHHTDAKREWAYDRESPIGHLVRGLDEAAARQWLLVDMATAWTTVFPQQSQQSQQ